MPVMDGLAPARAISKHADAHEALLFAGRAWSPKSRRAKSRVEGG